MSIKSDEINNNQPILVPLVFEKPCAHMIPFGPCLAHITIYKYKLVTKMAYTMGFPTETHKFVKISPIGKVGNEGQFTPVIMELNFGSKKY